MLKNISQLATANLIKVIASICQVLFFAMMLSQEQYGAASYLVALSLIISSVSSEGIRVAILRGRIRNLVKSIIMFSIVNLWLCTLVGVFLFNGLISREFPFLLVTSFAQAFVIITIAIFTNTAHISRLSLFTSVSAVLAIILSIGTTWFYLGDLSLLLFYFYNSCIFLILSSIYVKKSIQEIRKLDESLSNENNQLKYLANSALGIALTQSPIILGNAFLSPQVFGSFALALRLIEFGIRLPVTILNTVLASRVKETTDKKIYSKDFSRVSLFFFFYSLFGSISLILFSAFVPSISTKVDAAISEFDIIALIFLLYGITALLFQHYLLSNKIDTLLLLNSTRAGVLLLFLNYDKITDVVVFPIVSFIIIDSVMCFTLFTRVRVFLLLVSISVLLIYTLNKGLLTVVDMTMIFGLICTVLFFYSRKSVDGCEAKF